MHCKRLWVLTVALTYLIHIAATAVAIAQQREGWPQSETPPIEDGAQFIPPPDWFQADPEGFVHPDDPRGRNSRGDWAETNEGSGSGEPIPETRRPGPGEERTARPQRQPAAPSLHLRYLATYPAIPPLPYRRMNGPQARALAQDAGGETTGAVPSADAAGQIEAPPHLNDLLVLAFSGTAPSNQGVRAIRSLIGQDAIAGVFIQAQNATSGRQLDDLVKSLKGGSKAKNLLVIASETGGANSYLTFSRGKPWLSQRDLGSRGDPQFAHLTYRQLAANLAQYGINVNLGPVLVVNGGDAEDRSFGSDPRHVAAFARTFALGHMDAGVLAVPVIPARIGTGGASAMAGPVMDDSQTLATVALTGFPAPGAKDWVLPAEVSSHLRARICGPFLPEAASLREAVAALVAGCDLLIVEGGTHPDAARNAVAAALSGALNDGTLSDQTLAAAAGRAAALLGPSSRRAVSR